MRAKKNMDVFFELVKSGLWEREIRLLPYGTIDDSELWYICGYRATSVGL